MRSTSRIQRTICYRSAKKNGPGVGGIGRGNRGQMLIMLLESGSSGLYGAGHDIEYGQLRQMAHEKAIQKREAED